MHHFHRLISEFMERRRPEMIADNPRRASGGLNTGDGRTSRQTRFDGMTSCASASACPRRTEVLHALVEGGGLSTRAR